MLPFFVLQSNGMIQCRRAKQIEEKNNIYELELCMVTKKQNTEQWKGMHRSSGKKPDSDIKENKE